MEPNDSKTHSETSPTYQAAAAADVEAAKASESVPNSPETQAESSVSAEAAEIAALKSELEATRRRVDELARAYQALGKDREEFKQRLTRERDRMLDVEKGKVAVLVLEALDELDRCLHLTPENNSPLAQGVKLIRDGLLKKVEGTGVSRMSLLGQTYDPNVAEAADMEMTTDPDEDQKIVLELQAGYRLNDKVIRPARVKVAKYVQPANA